MVKGEKEQIDRRSFLKKVSVLFGGISMLNVVLYPFKSARAATRRASKGHQGKLIFIAIDALHPKYFELDAKGMPGGGEGNWLMPNIHAFLKKSLWYKNARCYLPAATDMNHLNALAGTSSAQTGIISVWAQPTGWTEAGDIIVKPTSMSFARDDKGRPVDTLFHAWKRRRPDSKTMLITGKEWVGEMFRGDENTPSDIDILVTGPKHPEYLNDPQREILADPHTDEDAACDP
jgi:predicted AlkP superfamily pyrophosphatase or phosphodiesterase